MYYFFSEYLQEFGGDAGKFEKALNLGGQRVGQAFFNALSTKDQELLRGTIRDPFYKDSIDAVYLAIEFLMDRDA